MRCFPFAALHLSLGLVSVSPAIGQRLAVYDPVATGGAGILELTAPSPLLPPGSPPVIVYPGAPILPPPPPFFVPPGDSTFNGITGLNWFSNGMMIASAPTPDFPPGAAPLPPMPVPPAVLGPLGGPVTGMAISPAAGVLFLVSAPGLVVGVAPVPGFPIVVPPFPIPFPTGPISGLDWDGMTGTLLAVDVGGIVYSFFPGGFPAGPPVGPPLFPPPGPVNDVAIDKTGNLNAVGLRAIYVVAGPMVIDITAPFPAPLPGGSPMATGLAFVPHRGTMPPIGVCPCPTYPGYGIFATAPMTAGNLAFGVGISGLPAGQIAVFALDFGFSPAFPFINGVGCGLGFLFGAPTLASGAAFAGPGGTAVYPLPLAVPPGTGPIYCQAGTLCPADPAGFVLTPMMHLAACGL